MSKTNRKIKFKSSIDMRRILPFLFLVLSINGFSQINTDPNQTYINVNTPRTPESAGFEKYGTTQVNEFTGTTNISIPIYTLKSRFLEAPITLSYQATGIRVNQEASWVGLGWDLNAGGRITVEIRGCADFNGTTRGLSSPTNLAAGMQGIFNRLSNARENAVLTPSTICEGGTGCSTDPNFDNLAAIQEMTEFGTGEPDIFRANFMGHSLTYYVDKISNSIKFIGEQSLFNISYTLDGFNNITAWTIIDDDGVTYYFNQAETTTNTLPGNAVIPATTTSAWLLTKAVHPSGDYIQYTYNNYGYAVPAFTMSGWVNWVVTTATPTLSIDNYQNIVMQSPYYLTRVESQDAAVDFTLDTRTDLYGPGSRKLTQIKVSDKLTGIVKKTATFNYSYFQSSYNPWASYLSGLTYYFPSPLTNGGYIGCSSSRLRLDSVSINLNSYHPPYRFTYNATVPDKYEYGQDHWGYYNGASNATNGYSFTHLIPFSGIGGVQNVIPASVLNTSNIGTSRECDPWLVQAMVLNSIVYPTGGSTSFTYEPHQSNFVTTGGGVTGGGIRIKTISNYESGNLIGTTNYTYSGGKYMGNIHYWTDANELSGCTASTGQQKYSSTGAVNFNEILIGYAQITIAGQSPTGQSNGYLVKTFNISTPSSNYSNGLGFDLAPPYFPAGESHSSINGWTYDMWLDPLRKNFPPTPSANLEGKLTQEQYFDSLNNLIKSVNYYYHLANYINSLYDIRAVQNRDVGFTSNGCSGGSPNGGWGTGGNRPVYLFVSPAKSFHALKDSVIETTYSGSNFIRKKIAYLYNPFYQPMFETQYNSDSTQTINYTRTSAEIHVPQASAASGLFATQMYQMYAQHVLDLPIEQIVIHRGTAGDSSVIRSRFNVYQNALPLQVYEMESPQPLVLRSQFVPWYYVLASTYSVAIDNHYNLYTTADYSSNNLIWTLHTLQGNKAFIWDENYNEVLAQCTNADAANVAFTSFETAANGSWIYNSSAVVLDNTAPTGGSAYNLSASNNISISALSNSTSYVVSYWSKTGSNFTVSGTTSIKQGKTINGWTYFEHIITGATSLTISGTGSVDEVRLYPTDAQMVSYTYSPLIGMTSQCDADNRITYYFYDGIGRLKWIKDQDGNIIKTFQYHYQSLSGIQY
jgi:hypothetical protein